MECPACTTENPPQARFCLGCAAPLGRRCSACGTVVPAAARFCMECAHPVATESSLVRGSLPTPPLPTPNTQHPAPDASTPRHLTAKIQPGRDALQGERKQVTVLFADVVGSTELIRDRDPEEAQRLLDGVVRRMAEAVHRYEGTVSRLMGDGLMAMFGAPVAHEDHAVRACYAALAMQDAVRRSLPELRRAYGTEVQIRVGINSGEVIVRLISDDLHRDYTAMGQTVHLASRLEQLAAGGSVRLSAATVALAEGYVQVRSLGPVPVKGLAEPVEIFELVGAGAARTRLQASLLTAGGRGLTRFVGRDAEMQALHGALARAGAGQGQVAALVGEPGVGKSRLVWELTHSHRVQGWQVLESGSVSYGKATAYLPVIDLLKAYCRIEARDDARAIREKVTGKLLALDRALEPSLPPLLALLDALPEGEVAWHDLDPAQRRRQTLDAVRRLLLRESREQPLLLVFEDLHWIDSETQALLDSLVESLTAARILLLVNYRPEYRHNWTNRGNYTQLRIDPLPEESAEELLAGLLSDDSALDPLKGLLRARTEGNPLFLEESVRSLVESGALVGERGAYRLTGPLSGLRVPATVQAVLAARIDRLPSEEKRLLQIAAVIGKDVPDALLREVGERSDDELRRVLAHLQAAEFLYEASLFPEPEYTFKHALTHEVAYGGLLQERRKELHARVMQAIERVYVTRLEEQTERLAHHALRAEDWERAVTHCQRAGLRALTRSAYREAIPYFEQALTALDRLPKRRDILEQRIDALMQLRAALLPIAEIDRMMSVTLEAVDLAESIGDQARLSRALARLTHSFFAAGEIDRSIEAGERSLALATTLSDLELQVSALSILGQARLVQGDYRRAVEGFTWIGNALASADASEPVILAAADSVTALNFSTACLAQLGEFQRATDCGQEAIRRAESVVHWYCLAQAHIYLGLAYVRRGDARRAIVCLERAADLCGAWHIAHLAPLAGAYLGAAYALAGRLDEAETQLKEALSQAIARGRLHGAHRDVFLGEVYLEMGRPHDASEVTQRALSASRSRGERADQAYALQLLGRIAARSEPPDHAEAEARYREALALAEELEMRPLQAHCHLGLGKLYRQVGRAEEARAELTTAIAMLREMGMTFWLPEAEAALAAPSAMS